MFSTIRQRSAAIAASIVVCLVVACTVRVNEPVGPGGGGSGHYGSIKIVNQTNTSLWYVYLRTAGTSAWGNDVLGSSQTIQPGDSLIIDSVTPGSYDLRVETAGGVLYAQYLNASVSAGATYTWNASALSGSPMPSGARVWTMTYTPSTQVLYTTTPTTYDTMRACSGSFLQTVYDTTDGYIDTLTYTLSGTTLTIEDWETSYGSAQVRFLTTLTRGGSGTGLIGTWSFANYTYEVLSGSLTGAERAEVDSGVAGSKAQMSAAGLQVGITASTISYVIPLSGVGAWWAYSFRDYVGSDTTYDLTITMPSSSTVQIRGNVTMETVTVLFQSTGSREFDYLARYSSSNPSNATTTYYNNPSTCPNQAPAWFDQFLTDNRTVIIKRAASAGQSRSGGLRGRVR